MIQQLLIQFQVFLVAYNDNVYRNVPHSLFYDWYYKQTLKALDLFSLNSNGSSIAAVDCRFLIRGLRGFCSCIIGKYYGYTKYWFLISWFSSNQPFNPYLNSGPFL